MRLWRTAALLVLMAPAMVVADMLAPGRHAASEGPRYWVSRIQLEYATSAAALPETSELAAVRYALGVAEDGYVGPRRGGRNVWFQFNDMDERSPVALYASALRELSEQVVAELCSRGWVGAYVSPDPTDIHPVSGQDLRPQGRDVLRLRIYVKP